MNKEKMPNKFYVYSHWTADTHEIFYIGKGCDNRAYQKTKRNKWWKSIVKAHGFIVDFYIENILDDEAKTIETKLILDIGRKDQGHGPLVNTTDGGEGRKGFKISEETREKMRIAQRGKKLSDNHKKHLSEANLGKTLSEETKEKIKHSLIGKERVKGYKLSESHKSAISQALAGRQLSEEHKRRLSEANTK